MGTTVANLSLGEVLVVKYDPVNGYLYAAEPGDEVAVIQGSTVLTNISVDGQPVAMVVDDENGWVYVQDVSSEAVISVINGTQVISTFDGGSSQAVLGIDLESGYLYASGGFNEVEVFNGSSEVADVTVGGLPMAFLDDPFNGFMYATTSYSDNLSVFNGSTLIGTPAVGLDPTFPCLDPVSQLVYVPTLTYDAIGGPGNVTVVNGTRVVASIPMGQPYDCTADPRTGDVYVTNPSNSTVTVVNGTHVAASLTVGVFPFWVIFDSGNGFLYVTNSESSNVSILNGSTVLGSVAAQSMYGYWWSGNTPSTVAYDPGDADIYVAAPYYDSVAVISTALGLTGASAVPPHEPPETVDLASSSTLMATLWAVGTGHDHASFNVTPVDGLGCLTLLNFTPPSPSDLLGRLSVNCTPTRTGNYSLEFVATDTSGARIASTTNIAVLPAPRGTPVTPGGHGVNETRGFIDEELSFTEQPIDGSGTYTEFSWSGLPIGNCTGLNSSTALCDVPTPTVLVVTASFSDSNGGTGRSPRLIFTVVDDLVAGNVTANRSSGDVGQQVTFRSDAHASAGAPVTYTWEELPTGCLPDSMPTVDCELPQAGTYTVSVTVEDRWGEFATSSDLPFLVFVDPYVTTPTANRSSLDVGQSVGFLTAAYGGSGGSAYTWHDLPSGCPTSASASILCTPRQPGILQVWTTFNDTNGVGAVSPLSAPTPIFSDPQISPPVISSSTTTVGTREFLSVLVSGGFGNSTVLWTGLPPGCPVIGTTITCSPKTVGNYSITATATDGNGFRVVSTAISLVVANVSVAPPNGFPFLDLAGIGLAAVVAVGIGVVLFLRRRSLKAKAEGRPEDPDSGA
jgi:DNA-binding beta-propeller fold protein YncE